jgi:hypothetical protein
MMRRVVKQDGGCWLYTGPLAESGYGSVSVKRAQVRVHRLAWSTVNGAIPDGLVVCHRCDVRNCVNPDHLFIGTVADNARDMVNKGRSAKKAGEEHNQARLTIEQVREMRALSDTGVTNIALAARFGISNQQVAKIVLRQRWRMPESEPRLAPPGGGA